MPNFRAVLWPLSFCPKYMMGIGDWFNDIGQSFNDIGKAGMQATADYLAGNVDPYRVQPGVGTTLKTLATGIGKVGGGPNAALLTMTAQRLTGVHLLLAGDIGREGNDAPVRLGSQLPRRRL
jgi:hypothetical protein